MNLPSAVVPARPTAELIEECAATVRKSRLARQRVAAALGDAMEQLALVRHHAHLLREEARGTGHAAHDLDSPAPQPLVESCHRAVAGSVTRPRQVMDGA